MDLIKKLEQRISPRLFNLVLLAADEAKIKGYALYLVGGAVRDLLLDRVNIDLDLVVEGDAIELATAISEKTGGSVKVHDRFGTAKIILANFSLDIVTARSETYEKPGALPVVTQGSIHDDLSRRDFTINAMAVGLSPPNYGELIDLHSGLNDLHEKLIRILHERSFIDDATRLLRALRYERRLNFTLENNTAFLAAQHAPMLNTISGDRLRHELELIFAEEEPEKILIRAEDLGILPQVHGELKAGNWISEKFRKALSNFFPKRPPFVIYLSLLAWNLDSVQYEALIVRLKLPARVKRIMRDTLRLKSTLHYFNNPNLKNSDVFEKLSGFLPQSIQVCIAASDSVIVTNYLKIYLDTLRFIKSELDGATLKHLGITQGPAIGKILHTLRCAKMDGLISTRTEEEEMAKRISG